MLDARCVTFRNKRQHRADAQNKADAHQAQPIRAPTSPSPHANEGDDATKACKGTDKPELSCEAISAQAAIEQARDADWSIYIGFSGCVIGACTLLAAGFAAWYAREAARHTEVGANESKRNADAAEKAVTVSEKTANDQLRSYMFPSGYKITTTLLTTGGPIVSFIFRPKWKNAGLTPALNCRLVATLCSAKNGIPFMKMRQPEGGGRGSASGRTNIGAGAEVLGEIKEIAIEKLQRVFRAGQSVYIFAFIEYNDIFGQSYREEACSEIIPVGDFTAIALNADPRITSFEFKSHTRYLLQQAGGEIHERY
jgi:hypothetical protein